MRTFRQLITLFIVFISIVLCLTGCSSNSDSTRQSSTISTLILSTAELSDTTTEAPRDTDLPAESTNPYSFSTESPQTSTNETVAETTPATHYEVSTETLQPFPDEYHTEWSTSSDLFDELPHDSTTHENSVGDESESDDVTSSHKDEVTSAQPDEITEDTTIVLSSEPEEVPSGGDDTVWVPTRGGKKYHIRAGCSNMKEPLQVSKSEAESQGFEPCKRCYR